MWAIPHEDDDDGPVPVLWRQWPSCGFITMVTALPVQPFAKYSQWNLGFFGLATLIFGQMGGCQDQHGFHANFYWYILNVKPALFGHKLASTFWWLKIDPNGRTWQPAGDQWWHQSLSWTAFASRMPTNVRQSWSHPQNGNVTLDDRITAAKKYTIKITENYHNVNLRNCAAKMSSTQTDWNATYVWMTCCWYFT